MANNDPPTDMLTSSQLLSGDMTQTPKQLSTSDMAMLLNSDNTELQTVSSIGQNITTASLDVLDTVNNAAKHADNSQNIVPQAVIVSQSGVLNASQVSLLNSANKRVILQPSNSSMNALMQNLAQNPGTMIQGVKRPAPGQQMVTKFIIQKNPGGEQQPVLIQRQPKVVNSGQPFHVIVTSSGPMATSGTSSVVTPQTITFSGGGILTASDHAQTLHTTNGKVTVKPATPTKIRMIPVSSITGKSPQKVIPVTIPKNAMIAKPSISGQHIVQTKPALAAQLAKPMTSQSNYQPVQVTGSKFNYVRLVNNQSSSPGVSNPAVSLVQSIARTIGPSTSAPQVRVQFSNSGQSAHNQPIITKHIGGQLQQVILPSPGTSILRPDQPSIPPARPSLRPVCTNVSQASTVKLPDGVSVLPAHGGPSGSGIPSGFTLVPAQYINSLVSQKSIAAQQAHLQVPLRPKTDPYSTLSSGTLQLSSLDIDALSSTPVNGSNGLTEAPGTRPRKPCNCTKSQCLKLYCDCFANGEFCNGCNCNNCYNNLEHEEDRSKAIRSCLERNPNAFHPKIGKAGYVGDGERRHTKGCNCKKSGCLKNYCECYEAKISCSDMCRCVGCKNVDEFEQQQNLLALADVAESRVQHIQARKARQQENKGGVNSRLPYTFITSEVGEATCACLLAQAEDSERERHTTQMEERLILQEYGRCLLQIIESANRTKSIQDSSG